MKRTACLLLMTAFMSSSVAFAGGAFCKNLFRGQNSVQPIEQPLFVRVLRESLAKPTELTRSPSEPEKLRSRLLDIETVVEAHFERNDLDSDEPRNYLLAKHPAFESPNIDLVLLLRSVETGEIFSHLHMLEWSEPQRVSKNRFVQQFTAVAKTGLFQSLKVVAEVETTRDSFGWKVRNVKIRSTPVK